MDYFSLEKTARVVLSVITLLVAGVTLYIAWIDTVPVFLWLLFFYFLLSFFVIEGIPQFRNFLNPKWRHAANLLRAVHIDFYAKSASICLLPFSQVRYDPKEDEGQVPTLLIHGYINNSAVWVYHRYQYRRAGFNNFYTIDLGMPFESIETHAQTLRAKILAIASLTRQNKIRLLGHSMGGVVAAYYILYLAERDGIEVVDLMTMGSPLYGTPMGLFGIGKGSKQMTVSSPFITELSQKLEESHIRSFHQGSRTDLLVFPFDAAVVRSKGEHLIKCYEDLGHVSFLFSDQVIKAVIHYLKAHPEVRS